MGKEQIFQAYESEVRSYCRNFPAVFTTAKGSRVTDIDGKEYIDFFNGAGALNYGHNNEYIKTKVMEYLQSDGIMHWLDLMTAPKADLIEYMQEHILKPRGFEYKIMFPGPTGTNAIESALKFARKKTGRSEIWALMGAFHGMTAGALSLTSDAYSRKGAGFHLENVQHMPAPYMFPEFDTVAYMQAIVNDDHAGIEKPAAVILETVQAEGGIYVLSPEYLRAVREFCTKNDILMIVDDIQVGCARTGTFFSFERAGIVPDIVCLSKSIGGIGLPFALVLLRPEVDVMGPGEHNGTFRGNQLGMVACKASLEYMLEAKVEESAKERGLWIREFLDKEIRPVLEEKGYTDAIRGIGCIYGIDLKKGTLSKAVITECFKNGLILERAGRDDGVVKLMPSLVIPKEDLDEGLEILKKSLFAVI